jgi:hypothetical protein
MAAVLPLLLPTRMARKLSVGTPQKTASNTASIASEWLPRLRALATGRAMAKFDLASTQI